MSHLILAMAAPIMILLVMVAVAILDPPGLRVSDIILGMVGVIIIYLALAAFVILLLLVFA